MGRLHREEDSGPRPEGLCPGPGPPPTSLEVMLSRSLVSSTFHSSARIACSICSCSEDLGAEPVSPGALSLLGRGTPVPFPPSTDRPGSAPGGLGDSRSAMVVHSLRQVWSELSLSW